MINSLSNFLNAGLLPIGEDDEKFKLLEAAASELSKKLVATPALAYRFALVGFCDRVKGTDPVLLLAETEIRSKWPTSVNKLGSSPVQIYRAVVLRALEIATDQCAEIKAAAALIAKNEPTLHSQPKERAVIEALISTFEQAFEDRVFADWTGSISLPQPKPPLKAKKTTIIKDSLAAALASAVGPTDAAEKPIPNSNPHWPSADQPWADEFVARAADAIFLAIQNSAKGFSEEIQESVRELMAGIKDGFSRAEARDAKSELLWLRMSMYSPSGSCSYRSMNANDLLYHSIVDVSSMVGAFSPPSVEHFLRDLVGSVSLSKIELGIILNDLAAKIYANPKFEGLFDSDLGVQGRKSWLDIGLRPSTDEKFEDQAGVDIHHTERLCDYSVIFYREIQIRKLLSRKP